MRVNPPARPGTVGYLWFWTFWHWSRESVRSGALLRDPIQGIAGHWDEWFQHEATQAERRAVEVIGETATSQRRFVGWLVRCWNRDAADRGAPPPIRFVLGQLAQVSPFNEWRAFRRYRTGYGAAAPSAIVLAEHSAGEATDVREVDAIAIPADVHSGAPPIVAEGFHVDAGDLYAARQAAAHVLEGSGLAAFIASWVATGRRPYSRALGIALISGWLAVLALMAWLVFGPDPLERLVALTAMLTVGWVALSLTGLVVATRVSLDAWRQAGEWHRLLSHVQVRVRMDSGLTLRGASAGLPFALGVLLSLYRSRPHAQRQAWLWHRTLRPLTANARAWAATGVVTPEGRIETVVLEQKLRASLRHSALRDVLVPRQREARRSAVTDLVAPTPSDGTPAIAGVRTPALGYARETAAPRVHPCGTLAQSLMVISGLRSRRQMAGNVLAVSASAMMLAAMPGIASILVPPAPPRPVAQSSGSPSQLWIGLTSRSPESFFVVLESHYWANRRVRVEHQDAAGGPPRADVRLHRLMRPETGDVDDGTIWIERRRHLFNREFAPGARVGRYSLSYLNHPPSDSLP